MVRAVRWNLISRRTREERKQQRKQIDLRAAGISEATQERYLTALSHLLPLLVNIQSLLHLDERTCNWIDECWKDGESIHIISDALCGLHFYEPWTKKGLPMSWKLFSRWRKLETPARAPPLTVHLVYCLASYAIGHRDLSFAVLLLLGFFALLRTGEILKVRPKDVLLGRKQTIISLFETKSGKRENISEMVSFWDDFTNEVLTAFLQERQRLCTMKTPIWSFSSQHFRNQFKAYMKKFDLLSHNFRPYSLRRGGATWVFQTSGSMEMALLKGRWGSSRVARLYIADGISYLPGITHTDTARAMLRKWDPFSTDSGQEGKSWKKRK